MKETLENTSFDLIDIGDECIFRDEFGIYIHAIKIGQDKILDKGDKKPIVYYTGSCHSVYKVLNPFSKPFPKSSTLIKRRLRLYMLRLKWLLRIKRTHSQK